jgi:hypothetical protein
MDHTRHLPLLSPTQSGYCELGVSSSEVLVLGNLLGTCLGVEELLIFGRTMQSGS